MSIIYEGQRAIHFATSAHLVQSWGEREIAWAEKHVRKDENLSWILGNFVMADLANDNGHIFPLEDLKTAQGTIKDKPLNLLHHPHKIVGHYVAAEMLYPTGEDAAHAPAATHRTCKKCGAHMAKDASTCPSCGAKWEAAASAVEVPYVEALAAFYKYYFPEKHVEIEEAHAEGGLFYSMECVPSSLICAADGCGQEFAYKGRTDESYCDHLMQPVAKRALIKPHFTGGALIIPPVRPGWKKADITEISKMLEQAEPMLEAEESRSEDLWARLMFALQEQARTPQTN